MAIDCTSGSLDSDGNPFNCGSGSSSSSSSSSQAGNSDSTFDQVITVMNNSLIVLGLLSCVVNSVLLYQRRKKYPLYAINVYFAIIREIGTFFAVFGGVIPDSVSCLYATLVWES